MRKTLSKTVAMWVLLLGFAVSLPVAPAVAAEADSGQAVTVAPPVTNDSGWQ